MAGPTPWPGLLLAALLVAPALWRPASRPWALVFLATLTLGLLLPAVPVLWAAAPGPWNWSAQALALAGTLCMAQLLVWRAGVSWQEMGFTWAQRAGSLRVALPVAGAVLALNLAVTQFSAFVLPGLSPAGWLYQATLPGLVEECLFRGVLLAVLDRAFVARKTLCGAGFGWGAVVVTLVFLALHGLRVGSLLGVLPAALLYLWLRARTGSLLLPVVAHNLWNLSLHARHLW